MVVSINHGTQYFNPYSRYPHKGSRIFGKLPAGVHVGEGTLPCLRTCPGTETDTEVREVAGEVSSANGAGGAPRDLWIFQALLEDSWNLGFNWRSPY